MKLEGKVALITGSGRGIGQTMALLFAREGADIAVSDVDLQTAERTAAEIRSIGRKAIAIKADVGEPQEVDRMVDRTLKELGDLHILVNNAGILDEAVPTIDSSVERWDQAVRVILRGTYLCCRSAGRWMVKQRMGKIINIGSIAGVGVIAPRPSYGPAKAGVLQLTRMLALEWAEHHINVNCIIPGYVWTSMVEDLFKKTGTDLAAFEKGLPLGRIARPDDIANAALFLVSDEASYITGVGLPVDGGWMIQGSYKKAK
jgi:NAD(P)-dependent dehydrogenase (short-subunit alcohol dehydrogenase family)